MELPVVDVDERGLVVDGLLPREGVWPARPSGERLRVVEVPLGEVVVDVPTSVPVVPLAEPVVPVVPVCDPAVPVVELPIVPLVPVLLWSEPSVPPVVLVLDWSVPIVPVVVPDVSAVPVVEPCGEATVPCAPVEAPPDAEPDCASAPTATTIAPAAKNVATFSFIVIVFSSVRGEATARPPRCEPPTQGTALRSAARPAAKPPEPCGTELSTGHV